MTTEKTCVIIGASHAGSQLANSVRKEGWEGRILMIGDEKAPPYHRPPLSKALLNGEKTADQLDIFKPTVYEKANVEMMLGVEVESIDRAKKQIKLDNKDVISYDKLALCTGARVRKLDIPGAHLDGVFYLRTLSDAQAIQQAVKPGAKAVIVGGGYIGLETAASLSKLGMNVTVLEMMNRVLERVTATELSTYYTNLMLDADMVIIGIGVIPNTELAEVAGLEVGNGIIVDQHASTTDPDIVAAGDCTFHPNDGLGFQLRLESVPNAMEQAKTAAATICGNPKPYHALPWFWSDQYNIKLQIAGFNRGYDRVVVRGNPDDDQFVAWYMQGDKVLAADCINSPKEFMQAKKIIAAKATVSDADLANTEFDLLGFVKGLSA